MKGWYPEDYADDLYGVAHTWSNVFPDIFPTQQDAEKYILGNLKPDWKGDYYTGTLLNNHIDKYLSDKVSIYTSGYKKLKPLYGGSEGEKCRSHIQEMGYYVARREYDCSNGKQYSEILYLSRFIASVWIALGVCNNGDFEAAKLAIGNIEKRLVDAVKNKSIRQLDADGIGRLDYGVYQSDGLFLAADIERWAKDTFPACKLADFYDEETHILIQELYDEMGRIHRYGVYSGLIENPQPEIPKGRRQEQIDKLCETLLSMGYKKNNDGSIVVSVGDGEKGQIHEKCTAGHGASLFPPPTQDSKGRVQRNTFNGIWKDAVSDKFGRRIVVIDKRGG